MWCDYDEWYSEENYYGILVNTLFCISLFIEFYNKSRFASGERLTRSSFTMGLSCFITKTNCAVRNSHNMFFHPTPPVLPFFPLLFAPEYVFTWESLLSDFLILFPADIFSIALLYSALSRFCHKFLTNIYRT